jgi:hypothetical protein
MAKSLINLGTSPNDRTGDTLRDAGGKINSNINELYTALGDGTALGIAVTGATSGQVLKFNGTSFVPAADINTDAISSVNGLTGAVTLTSLNIAEPANNPVLTGVAIAGTAGQFTCTATTLSVGQTVTITGTLGGTGTITGYTTGKVYTISVTNGTTSFTLVDAGVAIVTTAGTPTGLTYTPSTLNLYFTPARARAAISATGALAYNSTTGALTYTQGNTDTVAEGTSNQYYTSGRFDFRLSQKTSSDLAEGSNLYFTNARARGAISGTGGIAYNSTTGVISVTGVTPLTTWTVSSTGTKLNVSGNGFLGSEENPTIYVYRGLRYQFNNTTNSVLEFVLQDSSIGVESVTITNGGSYASGSFPTVSFTGGTGSGATGTVNTSGFINTVTVTAGGSGYTIPPLVTFTGGGTGGAATAVLSATGAIKSIDVTNAGTSYQTAPTVSFTATTGTDATATAKLTYPVNEISVTSGGIGYTTAPTVVITGSGTGATATATVVDGVVTAVTVTAGGTGYYLDSSATTISFTGGGGTGATATSNFSSTAGQVTQIVVTANGTGYSSDVAVVLTGGSGSGAAATARRNLSVASITVTAGGTGYTTPTVVITQNTAGGEPGTITDIATATAAVLYAVSSVTITNFGTYTVAPTVAFSSGAAAGTAVLDNARVTAAQDFTAATAAATTGSSILCPLMSTTTGSKWKYRLVGAESTQVGDIVVV